MFNAMETLETRQMMSASAYVSYGTLYVNGTDRNDKITLDQNGSKITVKMNGRTKAFPAGKINSISVNVFGGDDVVNVASKDNLNTKLSKPITMYGGDGNDDLRGGNDVDAIYGEGGDDLMDERGDIGIVDGGDGWDKVDFSSRPYAVDVVINESWEDFTDDNEIRSTVEGIIGTRFNDTLQGNSLDNEFHGGGGNDTIMGFEGNDSMYGGDGNDDLWGGDGNDFLSDTSGRDSLYGEDGDDTLDTKYYSEGVWSNNDSQADVVDGGSGYNYASAKGIDTVVNAYVY